MSSVDLKYIICNEDLTDQNVTGIERVTYSPEHTMSFGWKKKTSDKKL